MDDADMVADDAAEDADDVTDEAADEALAATLEVADETAWVPEATADVTADASDERTWRSAMAAAEAYVAPTRALRSWTFMVGVVREAGRSEGRVRSEGRRGWGEGGGSSAGRPGERSSSMKMMRMQDEAKLYLSRTSLAVTDEAEPKLETGSSWAWASRGSTGPAVRAAVERHRRPAEPSRPCLRRAAGRRRPR